MHADAMQGLAGEIVRTVAPQTEADPAAVLASLLVMFGNAVGSGPHLRIEQSSHAPSLYVCIVGDTSIGRKGTSADITRSLLCEADPTWTQCVKDGLVSGEGVIHHVRNGRLATSAGKAAGSGTKSSQVVDEGVSDKRLCVLATEFAQVLSTMRRPDNTLSPVLRTLWDRGDAQTLAKNSPERTSGALVSILAHITPTELQRKLDSTEAANGFANRFLFIASRRSKLLPRGGRVPDEDIRRLTNELRASLRHAKRLGEIDMTDEAWELWDNHYERLTAPRLGLLGELMARGAAHVRRLAMLYALLDQCDEASVEHLRAALAVWRYAADSARWTFGDRLGDPLADRLLDLLRSAGEVGLTRAELREAVGHRTEGHRIEDALLTLEQCGLACCIVQPSTGGRRPERWYARRPS